MFDLNKIENSVSEIIEALGIDLKNPNFTGTPKRVAEMTKEILCGLLPDANNEIERILSKTFPCENKEMVIVRDIKCWSICPHHLLPVKYTINIGYIPNKKVLGLSKIPRLATLLAKKPILQEQLVYDIAVSLEQNTGASGVVVNIVGEHLCMQMRGIKAQGTDVISTAVRGDFALNKSNCKDEFMSQILRK